MTLAVMAASYLVSDPTTVSRSSILVDGLASVVILTLLVTLRNRLGDAFFQVTMAVSTGLISATVALNSLQIDSEVYYLLVVLYAGYFFTSRQVAVQITLIIAAYGVVTLTGTHDGAASTRWLNVSGVVLVLGAVVVALRSRLEQLIVALDRAAQTDPLTQLLNRRAFEARLREAVALSARRDSSLSLLAIDVDHFKSVNDRLGHLAGDAALIGIATALGQGTRQGEVLARVGGEEFSLLLPDAEIEDALFTADRVRRAVESHVDPTLPTLTVSVGVASLNPDTGDDVAGLQRRADRALYEAKNKGRNRVACGDHPIIGLDSGTRSSKDSSGLRPPTPSLRPSTPTLSESARSVSSSRSATSS